MGGFCFINEHSEFEDLFVKLEEALPQAVKKQRETGDASGALDALTGIINQAIAADTPQSSRASFSRAYLLERAFDKARLVYQREGHPKYAVASGVVSYFMSIKRHSAAADNDAARAAERRSPQHLNQRWMDEEDRKLEEELAADEEKMAKEELVKAFAAMTDACVLTEATRLLKKMKLDVVLAQNILEAVKQPPNNPWEMFNAVIVALGH